MKSVKYDHILVFFCKSASGKNLVLAVILMFTHTKYILLPISFALLFFVKLGEMVSGTLNIEYI